MFEELVGKSSEPVENAVERGAVRKFAEAIADPNPMYTDEEAAKRGPHGRLIAPPTFPRTFGYGKIEGVALEELGLIHGDHRVTYERPLFVGETVLCRRELFSYSERPARTGLLGLVVLASYGETPEGEKVFEMRDTAIVTPAIRAILEAG